MTPRTVLILCERAPVKVNPVPAVRVFIEPRESPLTEVATAVKARPSLGSMNWRCSYCGRRVQVVA